MTHYIVFIIVPYDIYIQGIDVIKKYINEKMYHYDKNLDVKPYIYMTREELLKEYEQYKSKVSCHQTFESFTEHYNFDVNGNVISTDNPKSLYDHYEIGGRWRGILDKKDNMNGDSIKISKYIEIYNTDKEDNLVNHVIDRNGNLHAKYEMQSLDTYTNPKENDEWQSEFENLMNDNRDDYFVCIDCHT